MGFGEVEDAFWAVNVQESLAWQKLWPNACKNCRGWGGRVIHNYPHSPDDFEVCEALDSESYVPVDEDGNEDTDSPDAYSLCHRCNLPGKPYGDSGTCKFCGHDDNDGDPGW